jgi:hypothetical protein
LPWGYRDLLLFKLTCGTCGSTSSETIGQLVGRDFVSCPNCTAFVPVDLHKEAILEFAWLATELDTKKPARPTLASLVEPHQSPGLELRRDVLQTGAGGKAMR